MALVKCYECSKEISDTAKACPHCGAGKAVECHECSKQISGDLDSCPNCGAQTQKIYSKFFDVSC
jgi:rRNA maturation endonuclease Nob1